MNFRLNLKEDGFKYIEPTNERTHIKMGETKIYLRRGMTLRKFKYFSTYNGEELFIDGYQYNFETKRWRKNLRSRLSYFL